MPSCSRCWCSPVRGEGAPSARGLGLLSTRTSITAGACGARRDRRGAQPGPPPGRLRGAPRAWTERSGSAWCITGWPTACPPAGRGCACVWQVGGVPVRRLRRRIRRRRCPRPGRSSSWSGDVSAASPRVSMKVALTCWVGDRACPGASRRSCRVPESDPPTWLLFPLLLARLPPDPVDAAPPRPARPTKTLRSPEKSSSELSSSARCSCWER